MKKPKPHISFWKHGYPCFRVTLDNQCQNPPWAVMHTWSGALRMGTVMAESIERQRTHPKIAWDPHPRNLPVLDVDNMEWGRDARDHKRRHIAQMNPTLSASARERMVKHYYDE